MDLKVSVSEVGDRLTSLNIAPKKCTVKLQDRLLIETSKSINILFCSLSLTVAVILYKMKRNISHRATAVTTVIMSYVLFAHVHINDQSHPMQ